jgi:hypothetical protein
LEVQKKVMESLDLGELFGGLLGVTSVSAQFVCAVLCAVIFAAKGKSWVGGACLGFFLGPLGVFIAIVSGGWDQRPRRAYVPQFAPMLPPRPTNTYTPPTPQPTNAFTLPSSPTHRFPGRCPNCNGPVHKKIAGEESLSCWYCGALIDGVPVG